MGRQLELRAHALAQKVETRIAAKITDFKHDRSTSLVHGLAGGVREWTGSRAVGRLERLIVKGGSFRSGSSEGRPLWTRDSIGPKFSTMDLGFRLVAEINS